MMTILAVDDNAAAMSALEQGCSLSGYDVITAPNLKQGLRRAKDSSFDCLVTDKNIGGHRGVIPLLDYMKEEKPFVPVIIWSGEDGRNARRELYCHDFVVKASDDIVEAIERALAA